MKSEGKVNESTLKTTSWKYLAETPTDPSECYMVSHITLNLIAGIKKDQIVTST